jgi:Xaa-Pro aminopeptidase
MSFVSRRDALLKRLSRPLVLFSGGAISRNYPANTFPFRADSNFLYFFERPEPGSAALFDPANGSVTLFLPERSLADALWHGEVESFSAAKERHRVHQVLEVEKLEAHLAGLAKGRQLDALAVADFKATHRARAVTGQDLQFDDPSRVGPGDVLDTIASLRLAKGPEELAEMRKTAVVTHEAHVAAMKASKPGVTEAFLTGVVEGTFGQGGCVPAYETILSVRGEVLHNHGHENTLAAGDLVLLDAGAEGRAGYCSDVTRCWPVGGSFTPEGRDVYELVLTAELHAVSLVKPGVRYRDVHLSACRVLAQGLVDLGLLSGTADGLVESGAHAMFFPHGLGHQIGLDVHDLEAFGDRVLYRGRQRSTQFGLAYLRMDLDLVEGMVFSIEPGLYFVPAILRSQEFRERFKGQVHFDKAERFLSMNGGRGFGGIRIEDDVVCTSSGAEVLTAAIPKGRAEIEALVGQG